MVNVELRIVNERSIVNEQFSIVNFLNLKPEPEPQTSNRIGNKTNADSKTHAVRSFAPLRIENKKEKQNERTRQQKN